MMTTTTQNQQSTIQNWYEDPNEQQVLLNLLNREGFLLEDAVYEILSRNKNETILHRGEVFEGPPHRDNGRTEIDLWIKSGSFIFLIESKRSEYDWIFLQDQNAVKDVHLITGPNKTVSVHNRTLNFIDCVSKQVVEVLADDSKPILCKQSPKGKSQNILPVRSSRDELVRTALRQALFNIESLIHSHLNDDSWGAPHRIFIPIIVTNAKLLSGRYDGSDVDSKVNLNKITLTPIKVAAFNHSEILRWGNDYEKILPHIGQPAYSNQFRDDDRFRGSHNKTVFILSKDHLLSFIDQIKNIS
ncbi:MAG: hypothetical protein BGO10_02560 [Chlamydia sp. 32-24]|nr:MAG: hypothetical protein BGO10_02560 [Chlamydia sp. 32-24]